MLEINRHHENPVLEPDLSHSWEAWAVFNGCPIKNEDGIHLLYRAVSTLHYHSGIQAWMHLSEIGQATSGDGVHFHDRRRLILPEEPWEQFGCEDPRVTRLDGVYYIFYTALSRYPFTADGIRVGVALSRDLNQIEEKHPVTPFNAKAMTLFPQKINGRIYAVLTANTDILPAQIALADFESPQQIWSQDYWEKWHTDLESHRIDLQRNPEDHIEVGAPPLKTRYGWLLLYSHIQDYQSPRRLFGIEAVLLKLGDPSKIVARTDMPLMTAEERYETLGLVPDVVFPSGALLKGDELRIYYGAADTTCCMAMTSLKDLIDQMVSPRERSTFFMRAANNPIITPDARHPWEAEATFNPAAIYEAGRVHLIYRAMSQDNTSVLGYASSRDGFHIDSREPEPVYVPREPFEKKQVASGNSGCEDPRLTRIGDTIYMCYTAFDGRSNPRVALTSLPADAFLKKEWHWATPVLISPPGIDDKDACIFPEKVGGKYMIFHRIGNDIDLDLVPSLDFTGSRWLEEWRWLQPRRGYWDSLKVGVVAPPIKIDKGWTLFYHGVAEDRVYRVGAVLLDPKDPTHIIGRSLDPIFEPEADYEKNGLTPNVVFPCGCVLLGNQVFIYYGGGDSVVCAATIEVDRLLLVDC